MNLHRAWLKSVCVTATLAGLSSIASSSSAAVVTFNNLQTGTFVGSQYFASDGLLIAAENGLSTAPDVAITFNSNALNTPSDGDLASPWDGGNRSTTNFQQTLVVARDVKDPNGDGRVDVPDAQHAGGKLFFSFNKPLSSFGFDAIHIHADTEPTTSMIQFYRNGTLAAQVPYSAYTTVGNKYYDPTVVWGDNTANHLNPITASSLGIPDFNSVVLVLTRGSAVDNITYTPATAPAIPEPAGLAAISLLGITSLRRFRR